MSSCEDHKFEVEDVIHEEYEQEVGYNAWTDRIYRKTYADHKLKQRCILCDFVEYTELEACDCGLSS